MATIDQSCPYCNQFITEIPEYQNDGPDVGEENCPHCGEELIIVVDYKLLSIDDPRVHDAQDDDNWIIHQPGVW